MFKALVLAAVAVAVVADPSVNELRTALANYAAGYTGPVTTQVRGHACSCVVVSRVAIQSE